MKIYSLIVYFFILLFAPLMLGIINKTKAFFAGRRGAPLLQIYFDIIKLLRKERIYSRTTTTAFLLGPRVTLVALLTALTMIPFGKIPALISFPGDLFLLVYLLGTARFFTVLSAMDTGSSFEGMGSSREVWFSFLAEPALLVSFITLARHGEVLSLSSIYASLDYTLWREEFISLILIALVFSIILLSENSRIPVDDPNTHLELTMIHEVMVLDHGGPDLGLITYSAGLKLALFSVFITGLVPWPLSNPWAGSLIVALSLVAISLGVGVVESSMARLPLRKVTHFLASAILISLVALILSL